MDDRIVRRDRLVVVGRAHTATVFVVAEAGRTLLVLIVLIPLLLGALILGLAGTVAVILRVRHSSFGRRPVGLSLGRSGVIHYYLDGVDHWPWECIAEVRAGAQAVDAKTGDFDPLLTIITTPDAPKTLLPSFSIGGHEAHPWLIYTAVRFWAEHPELRDELSTTFAQRRIEAWRDGMR